MACPEVTIQTILGTECIGDSLPKINTNFSTLGDAACDLITDVGALSAYANSLLSLLQSVSATLATQTNTLSTNMQNIGNYPYLEYAWVCSQNTASQTIASNGTFTTLTITNRVLDDNNLGSIQNNLLTIPSGTYQFEAFTSLYAAGTINLILGLYNTTEDSIINRASFATTFPDSVSKLTGQFKITTQSSLRLEAAARDYYGNAASVTNYALATSNPSQRTTIKLWKVG